MVTPFQPLSWIKSLARPIRASAAAQIPKSVVETVLPLPPEFDLHGAEPIPTPKWWTRWLRTPFTSYAINLRQEHFARLKRPGLARSPCSQATQRGSRVEIVVCNSTILARNVAAHPNLSSKRLPVANKCCFRVLVEFLALRASVVRIKHERLRFDRLQQNDPHVWHSLGIDGAQGDGVRVGQLRPRRLLQPARKYLDRIVTLEPCVGVGHLRSITSANPRYLGHSYRTSGSLDAPAPIA
jgi:hypothetical protein